MALRHVHHGAGIRGNQIVGEEHREGLVTDDRTRAQDGMPEPERLGLPDVDASAAIGQHVLHRLQ